MMFISKRAAVYWLSIGAHYLTSRAVADVTMKVGPVGDGDILVVWYVQRSNDRYYNIMMPGIGNSPTPNAFINREGKIEHNGTQTVSCSDYPPDYEGGLYVNSDDDCGLGVSLDFTFFAGVVLPSVDIISEADLVDLNIMGSWSDHGSLDIDFDKFRGDLRTSCKSSRVLHTVIAYSNHIRT